MRFRPAVPAVLTRVPLAGRYPAAVALALLALCPYLVLTTAIPLLRPLLVKDLAASQFDVQLTSGLANAAYAFGAVAAADLIQRLPRRRVYLVCEGGFVISSLLAVVATGIPLFATGMFFQGLFTGMLLVAALPPLITTHGVERLPSTAAVISLGLFGMVTLGPVIGGVVGGLGGWRALFGGIAALAAIGLTIGALSFEPNEPPAQGSAFDWLAMPLALGTTMLPFFGVSWLTRSYFLHPLFVGPVIVGLLLGVFLIVSQYRKSEPLMPVRPISNTLPVTGTAGAMLVGASFTTLLELTETYLAAVPRYQPLLIGALFAPQLIGVLIAAALFRRVLPTRFTPYLALSGLLSVAVAAGLLLLLSPTNVLFVVPPAALLLGYGAGAGVVPGLFLAGLSVLSTKIGPTFALVELLRSEAAFLVGPILLHLTMTAGVVGGFHLAVAIMLLLTVVGGLFLIGVYRLGGARPTAPDLPAWVSGETTAYHSPALAARLRRS
ncbi:MFS transporter [Streptomyces sp. TP-A0874]|uniref:MFS transporter n=1 Tax=Streptomyces sp. TP-A0874 TaxID=549819 RepID=UPI000852CBE7|nr:MFS transporter [Streptomyces sp. TP-A0874]